MITQAKPFTRFTHRVCIKQSHHFFPLSLLVLHRKIPRRAATLCKK
jgi:hypothetical protein